ncbi:hypothetical protein BBK82_31750 [Lentzea guizhouensis]|uniref:Lipoprotein n=1 Tax=Lentzea guizhouensis TaxID=1586287 RepID=A0A1B2HQD9_9PSEU|nr:hypothetical protein [Lentzea guizhouensis]ANZ39939.1 hypothetical protein BBK82_31750 [Lentzea guizhouensis]
MSRIVVLLVLALMTLSACGAEPENDTATPGEPEAAAGPVAGPTSVLPGDIATLQVAESPEVGPVVADGQGYTLYLTTEDSTTPPKPTCLEPECTLTWPPLLARGGQFEATGVDRSLLGTVKRPDGLEQVTIAGHPVHRFVDDEQAGDATGHGTDGTWFAISPKGEKAAR